MIYSSELGGLQLSFQLATPNVGLLKILSLPGKLHNEISMVRFFHANETECGVKEPFQSQIVSDMTDAVSLLHCYGPWGSSAH